MLTQAQVDQFNREGYLVLEDVIDPTTRHAVMDEYAGIMDGLYAG